MAIKQEYLETEQSQSFM